jgi:hypothetical protein
MALDYVATCCLVLSNESSLNATHKTLEYYRVLLAIVHADLNKEAPTLFSAVVEVYALIVCLPALGQEGAQRESSGTGTEKLVPVQVRTGAT